MDLPGFFSGWLGLTTESEQQAAITGLFQMLGVFVTGMVALISLIATLRAARHTEAKVRAAERERDERLREAEREREQERRRARQRDLMVAVRAELFSVVTKYRNFDFDGHRDQVIASILAGANETPAFLPFVPRVSNALLWKTIAAEIPLLPPRTIETLVLYYDVRAALRLFAEDMNGATFRELSAQRRAAAYRDYVAILSALHFYASATMEAIDRELNAG